MIVPMRNMEHEIAGILRSAAGQNFDCVTEFIVVDMGSQDRSVLEALSVIKECKLRGCVIQNGNATLCTAFNTGIYKAMGEYVTFLFPRRLYRGFICGYLHTARETDADFVYGTTASEEQRAGGKPEARSQKGDELLLELIYGKSNVDIGAVMLRKSFLLENHILFTEDCTFGFSEEFIYRALLYTNNVRKSPVIMQRDKIYEIRGHAVKVVGMSCLEKIEAIKRVKEIANYRHADNHKLLDAFTYVKLPDTVLSCVDILMNEGLGYNAIRGALRLKGYDELLLSGKNTVKQLQKQIRTWKLVPWMYHARTK